MLKPPAACLLLLGLCGCADLHWERALYEGQRKTPEQCRQAAGPQGPAPCPALPGYNAYAAERARLRPGAAPTTPPATDAPP